jgi:prophage antirepressor-like protein
MNKNNETFRMPEPKVFTFNPSNQPIRVEVIDNEPWFVIKDICTVLDHSNHKVAVQMLDEDEVRKVYLTDKLGRKQETWIVNESGLYNLIFRSNKPEAKAFRKWVTSEVLPSIRKTGTYTAPVHTRQRISRGELVNADMLSLLWTIGEFLNHGDQKQVAIEIGVSVQSINRVLNGYQRSNRILHALYKRAQNNRETLALYAQPVEMRNRLLGMSRDEVIALPHAIPTVKHGNKENQNARKGGTQ